MKRVLILLALAGLSACNRHGVADVTLDAAAAQRNATAAKTLADLQAADQAAQGPAPVVRDAPPAAAPAAKPQAAPAAPAEEAPEIPAADDTAADADTNG
jgi:hypothetical protein